MGTRAPGDFPMFVENVGARLRQALISSYGPDAGAEATAEALAYAREHWERVRTMDDPVGHLYGVGQSKSRWYLRRPLHLPAVPDASAPWVDPGLPRFMSKLPRQQRASVMLCHGFGWTTAAVAELLGTDESAVQQDVDRGLAKLRQRLGVGERHLRDVSDQLLAYAEILDHAAAALDESAADARSPRRRPRRFEPKAGWAVLVGAVAVVVVVGGIAAVSRRTTPPTAPSTETATPVTAFPLPDLSIELLNPRAVTPTTFEWEHAFAGPGGVALVDGTFHMMSAAYGNAVATVGYATSTDGVVWAPGLDRPVLDLSTVPWAPREFDRALPHSLAVDGDGIWHLYFEIAWLDDATEEFRASIGRATTRDPGGIWVLDRDPVVRPDPEIAWRSQRVRSPSVVWEDGQFVMLYVGQGEGATGVGRATSADGQNWTVGADPVLQASAGWEQERITRVDLIRLDDGFAMVFAGDTTDRRGLAVSPDSITWFVYPENPFMTINDLPRSSMFDSEFVANETGLLGFVENGAARNESEVVVLQVEVDLTELFDALVD